MQRIQTLEVVITESEQSTHSSFPISADGLSREKLITEKIEERVAKMSMRYEKSSWFVFSKLLLKNLREIAGLPEKHCN